MSDGVQGFYVTEKATRPAGNNGRCFYCREEIGSVHKQDCVLVKRIARVRLVVDVDMPVPASWDEEMIDFHLNESSWCSDNVIGDIKRLSGQAGCLCSAGVRLRCLEIDDTEVLAEGGFDE